jgi:hypothetical protein
MQWSWKSFTQAAMALAGLALAMSPVQAEEAKWKEVVDGLEEFRRPSPDWSTVLDAKIAAGLPLPKPADAARVPSDRSDPDLLRNFWSSDWPWEEGLSPSPEARRKVLRAVRKYPTGIYEVLEALPTDVASLNEVTEILEQLPDKEGYEKNTRRKVRAWLYRHGGRMREQVLQDCLNPDWEAVANYKKPDASIDAVMAREPVEAERIIKGMANDTDPMKRLFALSLLEYKVEPGDKQQWRGNFTDAAENPKFTKDVRELAVWFLSKQEWSDKEAWLVSRVMSTDLGKAYWFRSFIEHAPERWIPVLAKITGGENRIARSHAAELLIFARLEGKAAADALRPLLPWVSDLSWADDMERRRNLISGLCYTDLPECSDFLMAMLPKEEDSECIRNAALILAHYQVKSSGPLLKKALARCKEYYDISRVVSSIRRFQEFPHDEIIGGLVAYFTSFPTEEKRDEFRRVGSSDCKAAEVIGQSYAKKLPDDKTLVEAILKRSEQLKSKEPELAASLVHCVMISAPTLSEPLFADAISKSSIRPDELAAALLHCRDKAWDIRPFQKLRKQKGMVAAIVAVLTGDKQRISTLLAGKDPNVWTALLEASRLAQEPLDFKRVAELMEMEDYENSGTAAYYLGGREEPLARELLERSNASDDPDSLASWNPKLGRFGRAGEIAEMLRESFGFKDTPREIISLGIYTNGSSNDQWHIVIGGETSFAVHDFGSGRKGVGILDAASVKKIRDFLSNYQIDGLPSLQQDNIADGVGYGFTHASAAGTHEIHIENPPTARPDSSPSATMGPLTYSPGIVIYGHLVDLITSTVESAELKLRYASGAEILVPKETLEAVTVWNKGKDLRILSGEGAGAKWFAVNPDSGAIIGPAAEPDECPVIREDRDSAITPRSSFREYRKDYTRAGDAFLYVGKIDSNEGIWSFRKNESPELIAKGIFIEPLATPDGKWCVVPKTQDGKGWNAPSGAVRINLTTKEVIPVALEPADKFDVVTYLPNKDRFLLCRRGHGGPESEGPHNSQFHLLDATSGALERIEGDFEGLKNQTLRPLQAAAKPGCVWMAQSINSNTYAGLYDMNKYRFQVVREVEGLRFESTEMWVDEDAGCIYAVVNGDLIRTPLR